MENSNLHRISLPGREILLLGTAHISQESIEQVRQVVQDEHPDNVCVELDAGRLKALTEPDRWKSLDLKNVIRQGQLSTLIANLILASYQKRMGLQTGVKPGEELLAAVTSAQELQIPVTLADREVKVTLRRAWRMTPWRRRFMLLGTLVQSLFDRTEISEEQLKEIKQRDTLNAMMEEFGKTFPELRNVVISERDHFLAGRILNAPGQKTLAVVGAGHVPGITALVEGGQTPKPEEELNHLPPPSHFWKRLAYAIPVLFVASMVWIGYTKGLGALGDNLLAWVLMTGIPAAAGVALAFPHPLVILVAFVMAPLKPLRPFIGVGTFTALTQAWLMPPRVHEMETVSDDLNHWKLWWKNRLLRIILCFLFPGLPTLLGYVFGGMHIFKNLS
ncbi:MAG TPA: TraB/GumN family protein [Fibrobacteraceae bacterium]|nr:TraB/GumN family protein [Fibrobacteraceae bacterium]